jgi:hypothetical protein
MILSQMLGEFSIRTYFKINGLGVISSIQFYLRTVYYCKSHYCLQNVQSGDIRYRTCPAQLICTGPFWLKERWLNTRQFYRLPYGVGSYHLDGEARHRDGRQHSGPHQQYLYQGTSDLNFFFFFLVEKGYLRMDASFINLLSLVQVFCTGTTWPSSLAGG